MASVINIRNWSKIYEVSDAKRTNAGKPLAWVAFPTKHDGRGFRRLIKRIDGLALFAAFVLMVEVAGKMPTRGVLDCEDGPLTPEDLADKTGGDVLAFEICVQVLSEPSFGINWIEVSGDTPTYFRVAPPTYVRTYDTERDDTERTKRDDISASAETRDKPAKPLEKPKEARVKKKPTGPHHELIQHFCDLWHERYDAKYPFADGRDGEHVKWILAQVNQNLEAAKVIVEAYLADDDVFFQKDRHSIGVLKSQFRKFITSEPATRARTDNDIPEVQSSLSFQEMTEIAHGRKV